MRESTKKSLSDVSDAIRQGHITGQERFCPTVVKTAVAVYKTLDDGEVHTSTAIAKQLNMSREYIADILRACSEGWNAQSNNQGWRIVKDESRTS